MPNIPEIDTPEFWKQFREDCQRYKLDMAPAAWYRAKEQGAFPPGGDEVMVECHHCDGDGFTESGDRPEICRKCGGTGLVATRPLTARDETLEEAAQLVWDSVTQQDSECVASRCYNLAAALRAKKEG